jgi:hypothetical protein
MFFKKKKEPDVPKQSQMQKELSTEMYQSVLSLLKTALAQPDFQMTAEEFLDKTCPPDMFSEEERAQLLKDARGQ